MALSVAFLGPLGTYSHQATKDLFSPDEYTYQPCSTISDVFQHVEGGDATYGVVPIENSSFGSVTETVELLRTGNLVNIGETTLQIGHALMGNKDLDIQSVNRVLSHEQGLGQCAGYIKRKFPRAEPTKCTSTAQAAVTARDDPTAVAICSPLCAEVYGLKVIESNIQDAGKDNETKFIVLSSQFNSAPSQSSNRTLS